MAAGATQMVHWAVLRGSPRFAQGRMGVHLPPKASLLVHSRHLYRPPNLVGYHCLRVALLSHGIRNPPGSPFSQALVRLCSPAQPLLVLEVLGRPPFAWLVRAPLPHQIPPVVSRRSGFSWLWAGVSRPRLGNVQHRPGSHRLVVEGTYPLCGKVCQLALPLHFLLHVVGEKLHIAQPPSW